eukprot:scaffold133299_cov68-Phaeocystis_antarctica.AAC.5
MKVGSTQLTKRQSEHERKNCCVSGEAAKATVRMHSTAKITADRKTSLRCDSRYRRTPWASGCFLEKSMHATDDEARHQPAHMHEVVDERREADADVD